ncbi:hypothetical protein PMAYCL1PPCAC_11748, partial [Pristionchus mayeri]
DVTQKSIFRGVSKLLKTVQYENLRIEFDCEQDCSENFIPTLVDNRNLDDVRVHLIWRSYRSSHNIATTRKLLLQLPKMGEIRVEWQSDIYHSDDALIDDVTLLHLTKNSNKAELGMADCTAMGILSAFE